VQSRPSMLSSDAMQTDAPIVEQDESELYNEISAA